MKYKRGSAIVEASLVLPIVILILVMFITSGIKLGNFVKEKSEENVAFTDRIIAPDNSAEKILRYKWFGINII